MCKVCENNKMVLSHITVIVQQFDPNAEVMHWLEVTQLKKNTYSQPFVVPSDLLPG